MRVTGLDASVSLDVLQLYFENPKHSGGGTVTILDDQRHQGYVILFFADQGGEPCRQRVESFMVGNKHKQLASIYCSVFQWYEN